MAHRKPIVDPGKEHVHKCGWSPTQDPAKHGRGCGLIWAHFAPQPSDPPTSEQYDRDHCCPACGAGPWKNLWRPGIEAEWAAMPHDMQQRLIAEAQKKHLIEALFALVFGRDVEVIEIPLDEEDDRG